MACGGGVLRDMAAAGVHDPARTAHSPPGQCGLQALQQLCARVGVGAQHRPQLGPQGCRHRHDQAEDPGGLLGPGTLTPWAHTRARGARERLAAWRQGLLRACRAAAARRRKEGPARQQPRDPTATHAAHMNRMNRMNHMICVNAVGAA